MLALVYYASTIIAVIAGARRAARPRPDLPFLITTVTSATLAAALLFAGRHSNISAQHTIVGVVVGSLGFVVIPAVGYYALGRRFVGRPKLLAMIWAASLIPLSLYLGLLILIVAGHLSCAPGAYECPV